MLRRSITHAFNGPIPIWHRCAMPLSRNSPWRGNFGANGRWRSKIGMTEAVTPRNSITQIDNEMMNYVQKRYLRHDQLASSYHQISPTNKRHRTESRMWRQRRVKYLKNSYRAYVQFETMRVLKDQARPQRQFRGTRRRREPRGRRLR